jgi:catechol 2,3-dioxygenase-like lactoylglutathione lyase family enzyme
VLGRFLEYSIATPDIRASLEFYSKLGFSQAQVGEAWPHPYAVVTDGRICLGLHQVSDAAPGITFVKPDLLRHLSALEKLDLNFEIRRLGNDVFNELAWLDPSGHLIRLVEARTFSPARHPGTDTSLCGYFLEIGLPAPQRTVAKDFWEKLGFVGIDQFDSRLPHVSCTSDSITVGLYEPAHLPRPTLLFDAGDVGGTLARLAEAGILPAGQVPVPLRQLPAAVITAPEGTPILLIPESAAA